MYVDGCLKRSIWEAQWLEHRLISEGHGIKLPLGGIFPFGSCLKKTTL